jgi:hypothetical protein
MKIKIKHSIAILGCTSWCGLGFVRGIHAYKYQHNKYEKEKPYMYINMSFSGILGFIFYANPTFLPFFMYKEIYRLEVNIRNLEDKKKDYFYNELI